MGLNKYRMEGIFKPLTHVYLIIIKKIPTKFFIIMKNIQELKKRLKFLKNLKGSKNLKISENPLHISKKKSNFKNFQKHL